MGLFNYSKPGPGVSKDAPKKKGIFLYFELFGRKFSKLITINLLYLLCSIPMMLLYFAIYAIALPSVFGFIQGSPELSQTDIASLQLLLSAVLSVISTAIMGSGPASAALAYILREYSKEEHVWLWSTFFGKMKENFKQEIIIAIIDLVFAFVSTVALGFYFNQYLVTGSTLWFALTIAIIVFSLLFMHMHYYIHQLIVTFENKLKDIIKNSMLFAMSTLFQCVLLSAFILGTVFVVFNYLMMLNPIIPIALVLFILIVFLRFPVEFYVHSSIKKTLKIEEKKEETQEEETLFQDSHGSGK